MRVNKQMKNGSIKWTTGLSFCEFYLSFSIFFRECEGERMRTWVPRAFEKYPPVVLINIPHLRFVKFPLFAAHFSPHRTQPEKKIRHQLLQFSRDDIVMYKKVVNPSKLFSLVHRLVLWSQRRNKSSRNKIKLIRK